MVYDLLRDIWMQSHALGLDDYDLYAIYPNRFSNRRYPPIPVWKKRFFDPATFTTQKLKQCLYDRHSQAESKVAHEPMRQIGWGSAATLRRSGSLDGEKTLTPSLELADVWKKQPLLFLSLVSLGLFVWLSNYTVKEVEFGFSGVFKHFLPKSSKPGFPTFQLLQLKIDPTAASLMAAIEPGKLDAGAIVGLGKGKVVTPQSESRAISLPQVGEGILQRLKQRSPSALLAPRRTPLPQFALPVAGYPITSPFGSRIHPILGDQRLHTGIDIGTPLGTPIRAAAAGVVTFVGWDGGYGNLIVIQHTNGYETRYAHLDELHVTANERVAAGRIIGRSGSTGYVTGPHLHFEIRLHQVALNPMNYLAKFANPMGLL